MKSDLFSVYNPCNCWYCWFFFQVTIHLLYTKSACTEDQNETKQSSQTMTLSLNTYSLAEESDNMIRIYCKLFTTSAVPPLPGKILPWKRVCSHLRFLVSQLHLMILISTSLHFPKTSPFITSVPAYPPIISASSFAAPFPKNLPCFLLPLSSPRTSMLWTPCLPEFYRVKL